MYLCASRTMAAIGAAFGVGPVANLASMRSAEYRTATFVEFIRRIRANDAPAVRGIAAAQPEFVSTCTRDGMLPIHVACSSANCYTAARALIDTGKHLDEAYMDTKNSRLVTPLQLAISSTNHNTARELLSHGASPNKHMIGTNPPLISAVYSGSDHTVSVLLTCRDIDYNAREVIDTPENHGWFEGATALGVAVRYGQYEIADMLLRRGADPNLGTMTDATRSIGHHVHATDRGDRSFKDTTPLLNAVINGRHTFVSRLLRAGANPSHRDSKGQLPIHIATQRRVKTHIRAPFVIITNLLISAGAALPPPHPQELQVITNERAARRIIKAQFETTFSDMFATHFNFVSPSLSEIIAGYLIQT